MRKALKTGVAALALTNAVRNDEMGDKIVDRNVEETLGYPDQVLYNSLKGTNKDGTPFRGYNTLTYEHGADNFNLNKDYFRREVDPSKKQYYSQYPDVVDSNLDDTLGPEMGDKIVDRNVEETLGYPDEVLYNSLKGTNKDGTPFRGYNTLMYEPGADNFNLNKDYFNKNKEGGRRSTRKKQLSRKKTKASKKRRKTKRRRTKK